MNRHKRSLLIAGTAMALSSFSVVSNALRLRFFRLDQPSAHPASTPNAQEN